MTVSASPAVANHKWTLRRALLVYIPLVVLAMIAVGPLLVLFFNSLKGGQEIMRDPLGLPDTPQLANYAQAWQRGKFMTTMRNSAILTAGSVLGVCAISGLAAYALSRLRVRGASGVVTYLFLATTAPAPLYVIPLFFMWTRLGQINSLSGLIVIYWGILSPFGTLLLRSFMLSLPPELEDAARVDGAGELRVLLQIILPLSWPGFVVVGLITALGSWNEFFFANTFIHSQGLKPVTTSFLAFQHQHSTDWELTSAASVITVLPIVALFLMFQRRFISGMIAGGLKG